MRIVFQHIKRLLYFPLAGYFGFWARMYLRRWHPTVVTVIGSSGKTTLLHLIEAQLGATARYSHNANSAFGIPFHILGLARESYRVYEWFLFAIIAPCAALRRRLPESIYVTEADAERPGEGQFLAKLLNPHYLIWLSLEEAHAAQYDRLVPSRMEGGERLRAVEREMAREFGYFVEHTQAAAILRSDSARIAEQAARTEVKKVWLEANDISWIRIERERVAFARRTGGALSVPALIPRDAGLSALAAVRVAGLLGTTPDTSFSRFSLPPGRGSVLKGIQDTTLIDSTYNATIGGMDAMLDLFREYPARGERWLVLGDMVEQGKSEELQHQRIAEHILAAKPDRIVLVGPRLKAHTLPILLTKNYVIGRSSDNLDSGISSPQVYTCMTPREAYEYLHQELKGGETILFKGARFLEGAVEKLLANPEDAAKLCRRGKVWDRKRKRWGV
ncbi:hypothetical protein HY478_01110 [Candidatus Uhrbacteria bacterium]|nr:hypothetical protein [Candidatus Uhrbacteria bacterium]